MEPEVGGSTTCCTGSISRTFAKASYARRRPAVVAQGVDIDRDTVSAWRGSTSADLSAPLRLPVCRTARSSLPQADLAKNLRTSTPAGSKFLSLVSECPARVTAFIATISSSPQ